MACYTSTLPRLDSDRVIYFPEARESLPYDLRHGHCITEIGKLPDSSVDVVITSPPFYGQDYDLESVKDWGRLGHEADPEGYLQHLYELLEALAPKVKRSGLVWFLLDDVKGVEGDRLGLPYVFGKRAFEHGHWRWPYLMHWVCLDVYHDRGIPPHGPIKATYPIIGLAKEPEYHYWAGAMGDYLAYEMSELEKGVPFQPIPNGLVEDLISASCPSGGIVLDPMCGSGTVVAVANVLGLYGIGIDADDRAIRASKRKVQRLKGERDRAMRQKRQAGSAGYTQLPDAAKN